MTEPVFQSVRDNHAALLRMVAESKEGEARERLLAEAEAIELGECDHYTELQVGTAVLIESVARMNARRAAEGKPPIIPRQKGSPRG